MLVCTLARTKHAGMLTRGSCVESGQPALRIKHTHASSMGFEHFPPASLIQARMHTHTHACMQAVQTPTCTACPAWPTSCPTPASHGVARAPPVRRLLEFLSACAPRSARISCLSACLLPNQLSLGKPCNQRSAQLPSCRLQERVAWSNQPAKNHATNGPPPPCTPACCSTHSLHGDHAVAGVPPAHFHGELPGAQL